MSTDKHLSLIKDISGRFGLDWRIVEAIVHRESGGDQWAFRYEPRFQKKYIDPIPLDELRHGVPKKRAGNWRVGIDISEASEREALAVSRGLMQVMGLTARGLGFQGKYLTELHDPMVGIEYGCKCLGELFKRYKGDIFLALTAYNGGNAKSIAGKRYAKKILSHVEWRKREENKKNAESEGGNS